ncbi:LITAF domain-containing protein [Meloidogyne graminicola]|uniref:LITAF domain-containing protein n=1 Tax=Meloidogyne graminicola TaxID=189291 RepID=A0A8S9ZPB7_9BILA|nr:LITAF domain-containing protein [Meloidogyne graminicola]
MNEHQPGKNQEESDLYSVHTVLPQIIIHQESNLNLSPFAQQAYCPSCKQQVQTYVYYVNGPFTWILFFSSIILCWIPLCFDSCKDVKHFCIKCNKYIGTFQRGRNEYMPKSKFV